ncbi:amidase family protein [Enemella sp. A6]|uniref:amidase family protein n=1 Tax=Enemella sp. A6 TaxID=3440152 RepID=UPI003EBF1593
MDLLDLSARALADALRAGRATVTDHLDRVFDRIAALDSHYLAFSQLRIDEARADAAELDALSDAERDALPLFGVPVAIKEEIHVAGLVTSFGAPANETPSTVDSEVVTRLKRAGAIVVGKTHMPEFGQAPYTDGAWGATRNPWHADRSPGGSSGGSGVAVATGMVPLALGGDGGGSIRIPAAWTGIVGIKPTRGRVPAAPAPHLWHKLGTFGLLARDVDDLSLLLDTIAPAPNNPPVTEPLRVGWTLDCSVPGVTADPQVAAAVERAARTLAAEGHVVHRGTARWNSNPFALVVQDWFGIAEEIDGLEYPQRVERRSRQTAMLARLLPNAALRWALRRTDRIEAAMKAVFEHIDVLLQPVTPQLPPPTPTLHRLGTLASQLQSTSAVTYTGYWNLAGNPAASVPVGLSREGLPLAVQVIGPHGRDDLVLEVARRLAVPLTPVDRTDT